MGLLKSKNNEVLVDPLDSGDVGDHKSVPLVSDSVFVSTKDTFFYQYVLIENTSQINTRRSSPLRWARGERSM